MTPTSERQRVQILSRVPLFSCFDGKELEQLSSLCTEVSYQRGDTVCAEGEEGTTFFIVVSGELEIWAGAEARRLINRIGPGEFFGEMSLMMGGKRSATVTVLRAARLLALDRTVFDRYFMRNPKVLEYMSRVLAQRLAQVTRGEGPVHSTLAIGVTGRPALKGKSLVSTALADLLAMMSGRAVLLIRSVPGDEAPRISKLASEGVETIRARLARTVDRAARLEVSLDRDIDARAHAEALGAILSRLKASFPFVVFDLGLDHPAGRRATERTSDILIDVVASRDGGLPDSPHRLRVFQVLNLYNPETHAIDINHCEPFVIPRDADLEKTPLEEASRHVCASRRSPASPPLHRLARKILGASVGIAVGGGAAFGIAHVGVMQVLEDGGVPIDVVAGTSMGSIIGIGYAAGLTPDDMAEIAQRIGTRRTTASALDFTLFRPGFLAGNRLINIFSPLLPGTETFADLMFPCRTVAMDIESGERVSIGSGRLDAAFRASTSVPMLWAPVKRDGHLLVDGGVVDPVPADVAHEMGADICIAVNVVPALKRGVDTILSRTYRMASNFNPLAYLGGTRDLPTMFDIVMNSMQMLQHELGNFKAIGADVRINPDLSDMTWIEFYRPKELIERGAKAADRMLPEIKRLLSERLAGATVG